MRVGRSVAGQPRRRGALAHAVVMGAGRLALLLLRPRVRVTGAEHVPERGAVLLAATHVSYVDFVVIALAAARRGRRLHFLCRADVWDHRVARWVLEALGHVPVDRAAPAAAYLAARSLLRQGEAVALFPEAGISYSLTVRPLMRGAAALAAETGCAVVPVAVFGTQRIHGVWPLDEAGAEPGLDRTPGRPVDVHCGEPFTVPADADLTEATVRLGTG